MRSATRRRRSPQRRSSRSRALRTRRRRSAPVCSAAPPWQRSTRAPRRGPACVRRRVRPRGGILTRAARGWWQGRTTRGAPSPEAVAARSCEPRGRERRGAVSRRVQIVEFGERSRRTVMESLGCLAPLVGLSLPGHHGAPPSRCDGARPLCLFSQVGLSLPRLDATTGPD